MSRKLYARAGDIARDLEVSKPMAYKLIAKMNKELEQQGYMVIAGRVPIGYYRQRFFLKD